MPKHAGPEYLLDMRGNPSCKLCNAGGMDPIHNPHDLSRRAAPTRAQRGSATGGGTSTAITAGV